MTCYEQAKADGLVHTCQNGIEVWPVPSRFGKLWAYGDGRLARATKAEAIEYASNQRGETKCPAIS